MNSYEQKVKATLLWAACLLAVSFVSLMASIASALLVRGQSLKMCLLSGGAVMTIAALIAQNRYNHFVALLTPNTFTTSEFEAIRQKYRRYESTGNLVFLALAVAGVALGFYGSVV